MTFREPVSPHLAARIEARDDLTLDALRARGPPRVRERRIRSFVVELPGGAFSPMTESVCCAEFARSLPGARTLLVAADRLGVLHDVGATTRACAALGLPLVGHRAQRPRLRGRRNGPQCTGVTVRYARAASREPAPNTCRINSSRRRPSSQNLPRADDPLVTGTVGRPQATRPRSSSIRESATAEPNGASWVTTTTTAPRDASSRTTSHSRAMLAASSPVVGSSSRSRRGR